MSLTADELYRLLPALYRIRDIETASRMKGLLESHEEAELRELQSTSGRNEKEDLRLQELLEKKQRGPLKALISVIAEQVSVVEADIAGLLENWFIETCDEWAIPYIGDLLGVRGLHPIGTGAVFTQRGRVANTLIYRRRKGTATVLEQLAFDTTGWRARAVEFFELLGTTQNYNHMRPHNHRTPDLRLTNELELLNSAFDTIAHTADVRRISNDHGRHNVPNIGIFLWRLQSYPVTRGSARAAEGAPAGCYTFNPLGYDAPLFNRPRTEKEIVHLAEEINVPGLLRRRPLYDELENRRKALADGKTPVYYYFDRDDTPKQSYPSVLKVYIGGSQLPVKASEISICNLKDWSVPQPPLKVSVDPVLGRITVADPTSDKNVLVSYAYGFSGDVGGGPYNRRESVLEMLDRKVTWQRGVSKEIASVPDEIFPTLTQAVEEWNKQPEGTVGVIAIMDSSTYRETLTGSKGIKIPDKSRLIFVAADWAEVELAGGRPGEKHRFPGQLEADELRPHLLGNISVEGTAAGSSLTGGELVLDGLLIEGKLSVLAGNLGGLRVAHSTLVPALGGLQVNSKNERLKVDLIRTICGPVRLNPAVSKLSMKESILDNGDKEAVAAKLTAVDLQKCTVFGTVHVLNIEASDCIFTGKVDVERSQEGCMRFSYVRPDSHTPRQYRCQPNLEISAQISNEREKSSAELPQAVIDAITKSVPEWLVPAFTSTEYGRHTYGQLGRTCPSQITTGAEDGSEMGVFSILLQPQRIANLRASLEAYLPFGMEAGIIYVTYKERHFEEINHES